MKHRPLSGLYAPRKAPPPAPDLPPELPIDPPPRRRYTTPKPPVPSESHEQQTLMLWAQWMEGRCPACNQGGMAVVAPLNAICDAIRQIMWIVRRLTPTECARLQGYPDDWCKIPPTTINGKLVKHSDSAEYKAYGNSIALPQWHWLMLRIAGYLPTGATLGSLFDGIGGFPLIHERIHGKGTALWSSEIEPFCVAVAKHHFGEE